VSTGDNRPTSRTHMDPVIVHSIWDVSMSQSELNWKAKVSSVHFGTLRRSG